MIEPVIVDAALFVTACRDHVAPPSVEYWNTRQGEPVPTKNEHAAAFVDRNDTATVPFAAVIRPLALRYVAPSCPPSPRGVAQLTPSLDTATYWSLRLLGKTNGSFGLAVDREPSAPPLVSYRRPSFGSATVLGPSHAVPVSTTLPKLTPPSVDLVIPIPQVGRAKFGSFQFRSSKLT